jgi:putative ubiquitin-RnfH superfamily antitoxin RatB of RatAB toxin-antitoxin module
MDNQQLIDVEVAYALPDKQRIISLKVPKGTTAFEAAEQSGIAEQFPEIDLAASKLGIFSQAIPKPRQYELQAGDRVEIYRPLIADPKEVRKARAEKVKAQKAEEKLKQKAAKSAGV